MLRFTAPHRLWLTRDQKKLVPEGHPEAFTLFIKAGETLSARLAFMLGVLGPHPHQGKLEGGWCELCGIRRNHGIHRMKSRVPKETKVRMPEETKQQVCAPAVEDSGSGNISRSTEIYNGNPNQ